MQWNGLAKSLCNKLLEQDSSTDAFEWENFRMWRLLEELIRYDCDIICLQEADFYEDIKPYLHNLGLLSFILSLELILNFYKNFFIDTRVLFVPSTHQV